MTHQHQVVPGKPHVPVRQPVARGSSHGKVYLMGVQHSFPPKNTGPIESRDLSPGGRPLGTLADCSPGSGWELHRGVLVRQMSSKGPHAVATAITTALLRTHARDGYSVMTDVYCDLSDADGPSLRAPDVLLVQSLTVSNDVFRHVPLLAIEIRGTHSVRDLEEKVKLYVDHDWPLIWLVHVGCH